MPTPSFPLHEPLRGKLERIVSAHLSRPWTLRAARDLADFASHAAALLSDGDYAVFAKLSMAADAQRQFEAELAGLRMLHARAGVRVPEPIGVFPVEGGFVLLMEAVQEIERGPLQWRQIGQSLAQVHLVHGETFGLATNGFFCPLPQDNTPSPDWPAFYAGRRLLPMLKLAVDSGNLPADAAAKVERLVARLPELCGPAVTPTLIHGDAQQNNFISSPEGAVLIDPAAYYGHPEMDLAFVDYFAPAPIDEVLAGYRAAGGVIDLGFAERRDLWRVWGWLACVAVEGGAYVDRLLAAVGKYL